MTGPPPEGDPARRPAWAAAELGIDAAATDAEARAAFWRRLAAVGFVPPRSAHAAAAVWTGVLREGAPGWAAAQCAEADYWRAAVEAFAASFLDVPVEVRDQRFRELTEACQNFPALRARLMKLEAILSGEFDVSALTGLSAARPVQPESQAPAGNELHLRWDEEAGPWCSTLQRGEPVNPSAAWYDAAAGTIRFGVGVPPASPEVLARAQDRDELRQDFAWAQVGGIFCLVVVVCMALLGTMALVAERRYQSFFRRHHSPPPAATQQAPNLPRPFPANSGSERR